MSSSEQRPKIIQVSNDLLTAGIVETPAQGKSLPSDLRKTAEKSNSEK